MNWTLLKNSLLVGALTTLLAVTMGFASALFLNGLNARWRRWFVTVAVLALVLALDNFAVPALLQVKVFPVEVWVEFNTNLKVGAALAMSWPLVLAPLLLLLWLRRRNVVWPRLDGPVSARIFRRALGVPFTALG